MLCAMGAFRARSRAICAGRALVTAEQAPFNPLVLGSGRRRPTTSELGKFLGSVLASFICVHDRPRSVMQCAFAQVAGGPER
jgi:hypothetical protein